MKNIIVPHGLTGKALTSFLIANKDALIAQKKSMLKFTDPTSMSVSAYLVTKDGTITKADDANPLPLDTTSLRVRAVANTCLWCDSQMDVLLYDCAKKSIKERKGLIPHIHDHQHTVDAHVGDVINISTPEMLLTELGINKMGSTQVILFETDIKKSYNEKVFTLYKTGKINQHSIGLLYVKIELAINDEESEKEYDFWNKYYSLIINKEAVDDRGYFWVVSEIKLLENSCVLFGSNEITPTLDVKQDTQTEPPLDTLIEPPHGKTFDLGEAIQKTTFIKI